MVKKFTVSLPMETFIYAKKKAERLHGNNLSAYINYLICKDKEREERKLI